MDDFYSDDGAIFARFLTDYELPDFVRQGSQEDLGKIATLSDEAFADPSARRFPIHDRANTFVSAAYCMAQDGESKDAILDAIAKRAELLGIQMTLSPLAAHIDSLLNPPTTKEADDFSPIEIEIGGDVDKLVCHGKQAGFTAQDWFIKNLHRVPFENRTKVANALIDVMKRGDGDVQEDVMKIAGLAECDDNEFADQLKLRMSLIPDSLEKGAALEPLKISPAKQAERLAAVHALDEKHKLARYYGERLQDPHRTVYNRIPKVAAVIQVGPKSWPLSQWEGPTAAFQDQLKAAIGEKAATLFHDGKPELEKIAALSPEEVGLIERYTH